MSTKRSHARELWFTGPRAIEVRDGRVPEIGPGQVLARAAASGVSQGTELLLYRGEAPVPFDPSRVGSGRATYPRRYGYAWVGEIVESRAETLVAGTRIFAFAPHGDVHALDAQAVHPLHDDLPASRAVLAANLEAAITCVWDSGLALGDDVVVLGGGMLGQLIAWLAGTAGACVHMVEPSARRRALALSFGAVAAVAPDSDVPQANADVVIEATGNPAALDRAIAHAGTEATVMVASFYGTRTFPVALGSAFHRRRVTLRASQVSAIPAARTPRWSAARRFDLVRRLLGDPQLDTLIEPAVSFDEASRVYGRLDAHPGDDLQVVFHYR